MNDSYLNKTKSGKGAHAFWDNPFSYGENSLLTNGSPKEALCTVRGVKKKHNPWVEALYPILLS
jgi:hypothetical protein